MCALVLWGPYYMTLQMNMGVQDAHVCGVWGPSFYNFTYGHGSPGRPCVHLRLVSLTPPFYMLA